MSIFTIIYFLIFCSLAAVIVTIISIGVDIRVLSLRKKERKKALQAAQQNVTPIGVTLAPMIGDDDEMSDAIAKSVNDMMVGDNNAKSNTFT